MLPPLHHLSHTTLLADAPFPRSGELAVDSDGEYEECVELDATGNALLKGGSSLLRRGSTALLNPLKNVTKKTSPPPPPARKASSSGPPRENARRPSARQERLPLADEKDKKEEELPIYKPKGPPPKKDDDPREHNFSKQVLDAILDNAPVLLNLVNQKLVDLAPNDPKKAMRMSFFNVEPAGVVDGLTATVEINNICTFVKYMTAQETNFLKRGLKYAAGDVAVCKTLGEKQRLKVTLVWRIEGGELVVDLPSAGGGELGSIVGAVAGLLHSLKVLPYRLSLDKIRGKLENALTPQR